METIPKEMDEPAERRGTIVKLENREKKKTSDYPFHNLNPGLGIHFFRQKYRHDHRSLEPSSENAGSANTLSDLVTADRSGTIVKLEIP